MSAKLEGSIAAAVQISQGSNVQTICREATHTLEPKREQLGIPEEEQSRAAVAAPVESTPEGVQEVLRCSMSSGEYFAGPHTLRVSNISKQIFHSAV